MLKKPDDEVIEYARAALIPSSASVAFRMKITEPSAWPSWKEVEYDVEERDGELSFTSRMLMVMDCPPMKHVEETELAVSCKL
jgi:hypothetical protein